MGRCKDCIYHLCVNVNIGEGSKNCTCPKLVYSEDTHEDTGDMLVYGDFEMYHAFITVGDYFGCIHFEPKEGKQHGTH